MKTKYSLCILFLLIYGLSSAQNESTHGYYPMSVSEMAETVSFISGGDIANGNMSVQPLNTGVYLQQVGDRNSASAEISSNKTNLRLVQSGNDNFLRIFATAETVKGSLVQNGDINFALDFADDPSLDRSLNLTQNGDGHHFESYGTNSIGNKLEFNMSGNSEMIIVRNFK